jgi:gamma-glutamyl:cysteine ligase YbdK (ATP-grasp superfamily)
VRGVSPRTRRGRRRGELDVNYGATAPFTLGVEEELQLVNGESVELKSRYAEIFDEAARHDDRIKAELLQSTVDVATAPARTVREAVAEARELRRRAAVRICDAQTRLENTAAIVALVQSLVQPRPLIEENKWRAARFGLDATLVDLERDEERPAAAAVGALAELAASAAGRLGCAEELDLVEQLLDRGDGAREQRAAHAAAGGSLLGVAQWLAKQTVADS